MGLMDKVKAQANTLAQSANAGIAKLDAIPAQRRADALLRNLGLAVLAERTGRATGDTQTQIDQILAELAQHEAQNNVDLVQQAAQAQAQQMQAQQARMNMQGDYLSGAAPVDPNVPPSAAGFPGQSPSGFPQQGAPAGFPQQGTPSGFPGQAPAGFPQQGAPSAFPGAAQTGFPQQGAQAGFPGGAQTGFPQQGGPSGFPGQAPAGFPQQGAPSGFPGAVQTGFPQQPGSTGFPGDQSGFGDQGGFPRAAQGGFPGSAPTGYPQQGGSAGFPVANPMGFPAAVDEPEPDQGQGQGLFPPSSGA